MIMYERGICSLIFLMRKLGFREVWLLFTVTKVWERSSQDLNTALLVPKAWAPHYCTLPPNDMERARTGK